MPDIFRATLTGREAATEGETKKQETTETAVAKPNSPRFGVPWTEDEKKKQAEALAKKLRERGG